MVANIFDVRQSRAVALALEHGLDVVEVDLAQTERGEGDVAPLPGGGVERVVVVAVDL